MFPHFRSIAPDIVNASFVLPTSIAFLISSIDFPQPSLENLPSIRALRA